MAKPTRAAIVEALLDRHGRTYAEELGIPVERGTPSALFRLLVASILFSARINAKQAESAARALTRAGWTSPRKLADTTWHQRARVLNENGYARYDGRTSTMLGEDSELLLDRYHGDLRRLRDAAGRDPRRERSLLEEMKGIGDVAADIFFREAQLAWDALYPFMDKRAAKSAERLGRGTDAAALARGRDKRTFARLVAALVRTQLAKDHDQVLAAAGA